jgi:hypothetical protein
MIAATAYDPRNGFEFAATQPAARTAAGSLEARRLDLDPHKPYIVR